MTSSHLSKIVLVIPVYNHAATLREVTKKALAAGWPVLVVDDGSTDAGAHAVEDLSCQVLRLDKNRGKGGAILAGAQKAIADGLDAIITLDADGQHDPAEVVLLVEEARRQWPAIVIGARKMDKTTAPRASLFGRVFSNFWVRLECGRDLPDTQSGFRLYPISLLLRLPIRSRRYDFEVEVLTRAAWAGIPVRSVPVSVHYPKGDDRVSHFHQIKDNFRLTILHTRLVLRALTPWPHRRLMRQEISENGWKKEKLSLFHPVRLLKRICLEHNSAFQLAIAVWMGVFLGALPLLAIHTVTIVYVAHKLHLNKVAAVAASQFCMPPLIPVICMQAGYFMRNGRFLWDISWETMVVQVHLRLWEWFLGSLFVGPILGILLGTITYFGVVKVRAVASSYEAAGNE